MRSIIINISQISWGEKQNTNAAWNLKMQISDKKMPWSCQVSNGEKFEFENSQIQTPSGIEKSSGDERCLESTNWRKKTFSRLSSEHPLSPDPRVTLTAIDRRPSVIREWPIRTANVTHVRTIRKSKNRALTFREHLIPKFAWQGYSQLPSCRRQNCRGDKGEQRNVAKRA